MAKPRGTPAEWNVAVVSTCCVLLGTIFGATWVALAWGQPSVIGDFLWRWQTILSAGVAGTAAAIAWKNVSRQLRMSMLTREEDRIDRQLPGTRQAWEWLEYLLSSTERVRHQRIYSVLESRLELGDDDSIDAATKRAIPLAEPHIQQEAVVAVFDYHHAAARLAEHTNALDMLQQEMQRGDLDEDLERQFRERLLAQRELVGVTFDKVAATRDALRDLTDEYRDRVERAERRRPLIRDAVDAYIGDR